MLKWIHEVREQHERTHPAWPDTEPTHEKTPVGCVYNHLLSLSVQQPTHCSDSHHQPSLGLPWVFFFFLSCLS